MILFGSEQLAYERLRTTGSDRILYLGGGSLALLRVSKGVVLAFERCLLQHDTSGAASPSMISYERLTIPPGIDCKLGESTVCTGNGI